MMTAGKFPRVSSKHFPQLDACSYSNDYSHTRLELSHVINKIMDNLHDLLRPAVHRAISISSLLVLVGALPANPFLTQDLASSEFTQIRHIGMTS